MAIEQHKEHVSVTALSTAHTGESRFVVILHFPEPGSPLSIFLSRKITKESPFSLPTHSQIVPLENMYQPLCPCCNSMALQKQSSIKMLQPLKLRKNYCLPQCDQNFTLIFSISALTSAIRLILVCSSSGKKPTPNSGSAFKETSVTLEVKTSCHL